MGGTTPPGRQISPPGPGPATAGLLSIVIPVYNEARSVGPLFERIQENIHVPHEILIVHDSPDDDTLPALEREPCRTMGPRLVLNRGRGALAAIKTGMQESRGDAVLVMMADLSDDLKIVDRMYELLATQGYSVICGSRYMTGGRQEGGPLIKRNLSRLAGVSLHHLTRLPTHDVTNSFKMYAREVIERFPIESNGGFEIGMELTIKAHLAGLRVTEIPSVWHDRQHGKSRFRLVRWLPNYLRWYAWLIWRTWWPFPKLPGGSS
jgi:dolichol-phosphate mannosyltransferase